VNTAVMRKSSAVERAGRSRRLITSTSPILICPNRRSSSGRCRRAPETFSSNNHLAARGRQLLALHAEALVLGRYDFSVPEPVAWGELQPLRDPNSEYDF
jgi:hypothetical protein